MSEKYLKNVIGVKDPSGYFKSFANFDTKEELKVGDLVALDTDGKLVKATHEKKPIGIVYTSSPKLWGEKYEFDGERDDAILRAGEKISLVKQFIVLGALTQEAVTSAHIGDTVYLGENGLTLTKPSKGFMVGMIERLMDGAVRFDLMLTNIPISTATE